MINLNPLLAVLIIFAGAFIAGMIGGLISGIKELIDWIKRK